MSTYAIGDIQGCYTALLTLLDKLNFNPKKDTLWFAGDLVNRGPESLSALRFVKKLNLENCAITVLGNHDFHLLASFYASGEQDKKPFSDILNAPDCETLFSWLRSQPLVYHDKNLGYTLSHAGIYPFWTLSDAFTYAKEVEDIMKSDKLPILLTQMIGNSPNQWNEQLNGWDRFRFIINAFTRMRFCTKEGKLDFETKGEIGSQAAGLLPWFKLPNRLNQENKLLLGHWSALQGKTGEKNVFALDGGYVWGNKLIAMRLEDQQLFSVKAD